MAIKEGFISNIFTYVETCINKEVEQIVLAIDPFLLFDLCDALNHK